MSDQEFEGMNRQQQEEYVKGQPLPFDDWIPDNLDVLYEAFIADYDYMKGRLPNDKNKVEARKRGFRIINDAYQKYVDGWDG